MQSIFVNEVVGISLTAEGIVQIQLGLRADNDMDGEKSREVVHNIIHLSLSLKCFVKAFEGQEKVMGKLMHDGLVKRTNIKNDEIHQP